MYHERSGTLDKARQIYDQGGVGLLFKQSIPYLYQIIWPYLPSTIHLRFNGVLVPERQRVTDRILPRFITQHVPADRPGYEAHYIEHLKRSVEDGDRVVAIGGGWGVSAVAAARQAGDDGHIIVYEGAKEAARTVRETAELNDLGDRITVRHQIVGGAVSLRGRMVASDELSAGRLPEHDVLLVDCDGCEFNVLESLEHRPETIVVEHHAVSDDGEVLLEYDGDRLERILGDLGYEIAREDYKDEFASGNPFIVVTAQSRS